MILGILLCKYLPSTPITVLLSPTLLLSSHSRASITGSLLGCLVAASNFYLGLKAGWTFGAQLFSAIFSFALLKTISKLTGSYFGPEENCTAQTAASTTGGLSVGFITGIPAMYRLGLMSGDVMSDLGRLVMWTIGMYSPFWLCHYAPDVF